MRLIPPDIDIVILNLREAIEREKRRGRYALVTALRNQLCGVYATYEWRKRKGRALS